MALELRNLGYNLDKLRALRGGSLSWEDEGYPLYNGAGELVED